MSRLLPLASVAVVGILLAASLPATPFPVASSWSARAPIAPGREGAAGSFIGGLFYVTHGFTIAGGDSTLAAAYDPATDTWSPPLAAAAVPRSELTGAAAVDATGVTKHFAIGGRGACIPGPVCSDVEIYDPTTNTWAVGAPMPTPRAGLGAATVGNLIYVVGGRTGGGPYTGVPLATLEVYDPVLNAWAPGPAMPVAVMDIYSVTAIGTLIYVIGGFNGATEVPTMQVYDTVLGAWAFGPPMPTARSNAIAGTCLGHIFVIAGTVAGGTNVATVEEFDPTTGSWSAAPPLPAPASELAASSVSGPNLVMATGSGIFGAALTQNYALSCKPVTTGTCIADGLLVTETDMAGGSSRNAFAESSVQVAPAPGIYTPPPAPYPSEPPAAQAHADARLAGASYANSLVAVAASTVFSRCDANAVLDPTLGLMADAYGIGGVQGLTLRLPTVPATLTLDALDFELQAFGAPPAANAVWTCDVVDVGVNPPPPAAALCDVPLGTFACGPPLAPVCALVFGSVRVTLNEVNPPYLDASGLWVYSGSHLHVHVDPLVAGAAVVDIYVGYVQVSVSGGPATPAVYVPHTGCLTPVCT